VDLAICTVIVLGRTTRDPVSVNRDKPACAVVPHEQPRTLNIAVDRSVIAPAGRQPRYAEGQGRPYEDIAPIVQTESEVATVDLDFGKAQQSQIGNRRPAQVAIVLRLFDLGLPVRRRKSRPQLVETGTFVFERGDHFRRMFPRVRVERSGAL
jgi:hypothetical protein